MLHAKAPVWNEKAAPEGAAFQWQEVRPRLAATGSATSADEIAQRAHTAQGQPDGTRLRGCIWDNSYVGKLRTRDGILKYVEHALRDDAADGARSAAENDVIVAANLGAGDNGK